MRDRGCTKSTVGIKLRHLCPIFNEAIERGIIKKEKCYPFGRRKYRIPTSRNIKKALALPDVTKIYYYETDSIEEQKAKDFWLFCYFANGMNPKDVAFLKFKNIQCEYLVFERAKTERTARNNPRPISVYINEDMWSIIKLWGNKNNNPDNYIFPVLNDAPTALEQHFVIKSFIKFINDKWLK